MTKSASIFDFTDDTKIIAQVLGYEIEKKEYLKSATIEARASHLMEYAELVNDSKIKKETESTFKSELESLFNE